MRAWRALVLGAAVALGATTASTPALAKKPAQVKTMVSATRVEVGDTLTLTLRIPGDPNVGDGRLAAPPDLRVLGSTILSFTSVTLDNGRRTLVKSTDVTWKLVALRAGTFTIPAPTAVVDGRRVSGSATTVEVVPSTGMPHASAPNPFNFPQMPGMPRFNIPGWPFGNDEPDDEPPPSSRPDLDLPKAADPLAFVRAIVDKKQAVVGEQVTVSYYLYCRFACEYKEPADPGFPEFKRLPLDKDRPTEPTGSATVGGERFATQLLGKMALFPLAAGDLKVGAMTVQVTGKRFGGRLEPRTSDAKIVHVTEPPLAGRPPGYAIGDVGQFSLTATVEPRNIDLGGSVAVTVRLHGTGFPPESVRVPVKKGIEWLDPEKKEKIDVQAGKIVGSRSFGYVVKLANSGETDLGAVELPYWDPVSKKYQVASAALGTIEVSGVMPPPDPASSATPPVAASDGDPLASLPAPRKTLGAYAASGDLRAFSGSRFW
ncbi:MAG TPA: BatD family protein, partial [Minicystis sp.]|nr:BatD family protein [Minicystis sp.]